MPRGKPSICPRGPRRHRDLGNRGPGVGSPVVAEGPGEAGQEEPQRPPVCSLGRPSHRPGVSFGPTGLFPQHPSICSKLYNLESHVGPHPLYDKGGAVGHPCALGEQDNQMWSHRHLAENGHQTTGCFPRGGGMD